MPQQIYTSIISDNISERMTKIASYSANISKKTSTETTGSMGRGSGEGARRGLPPSNTSGGHPCYWPLLENAKSASSLAADLGHHWKLKLLPPDVRFYGQNAPNRLPAGAPLQTLRIVYILYTYIFCVIGPWPPPYYKILPQPMAGSNIFFWVKLLLPFYGSVDFVQDYLGEPVTRKVKPGR